MIRFSPYGFIDPTHKQVLAKDFLEAITRNWILTWGHVDGSGEAIKIRVKAYVDKFVYNADYLHAPQKSYDMVIGKGNSIDNLKIPIHNFILQNIILKVLMKSTGAWIGPVCGLYLKNTTMSITSLLLFTINGRFKKEPNNQFFYGNCINVHHNLKSRL